MSPNPALAMMPRDDLPDTPGDHVVLQFPGTVPPPLRAGAARDMPEKQTPILNAREAIEAAHALGDTLRSLASAEGANDRAIMLATRELLVRHLGANEAARFSWTGKRWEVVPEGPGNWER